MNPLRRISLFKRFPTFYLTKREEDLVKPEKRDKYPAFADDFTTLDDVLLPIFCDFDHEALHCQNTYRGMYVFLILGSALVTVLGIIQIAFIDIAWIGILGSLVALLVGVVTALLSRLSYQKRYLNARLTAERLRGEYFLFLGHFDPYDKQDRIQELKQRVADIKAEGEAI